jgi:tRNA (cmo5U34)-methyltransferase
MIEQHRPDTDVWQESDSELFIEAGKVYTPARDEIERAIVGCVPAQAGESFTAVEIGCGDGWLSEALLRRLPQARVIALDGSETMRRAAGERLAEFGERVQLRPFRLEEPGWLDELAQDEPRGVRCFMSCLVIHHLDGAGKQALYRQLHDRLEPGGAVVIADIVEPANRWLIAYLAEQWDADVRRQSTAFTGNERAWEQFDHDGWNILRHPDPMDMPSRLSDHLRWLAEAGFHATDVPWARAAHAVYAGYLEPVG